ncbi:MAG: cobalamin-binding protein [Chloroflexi bacterium]|nr:cobalamin-binding protein [Chloroflexota bacterium]
MKLKRSLLSILVILILAACQPAASASAPGPTPTAAAIQITDGLGRVVTLPGPAQRIVSLAPSNTEILYALGAGEQVVGRDEFSDYPAQAKTLPSVGGSMGKYSLETIVSLKPDLVLAAGVNTPEQVKSLENLGLTVFYLANPADLNGLYTNLETVARLTGKGPQAAELVKSLQGRVSEIESRLSKIQSRPTVYYELDATDPSKPYTSGPGTFVDQLITLAGGKNIAGDLSSSWAQISQEDLLVKNPDIILLGDAAYGVTPQSLAERPGWDTLAAVKDNRIYVFDDNLVSRPTPRMVDGLETLAKIIHPEAFK